MTILVTGGDGQLGRALAALDLPDRQILALGRERLDVTAEDRVEAVITALRPQAVINAAAFTDVDAAETARDDAYRVNRDGAVHLARACRRVDALLVQVSTNYVFPGKDADPYDEQAPTGPLNVYGASKLAGEQAVLEAHPAGTVVLRTSAVFSGDGRNFVRSILAGARRAERLPVVADQFIRPTAASHLAEACLAVVGAGAGAGPVLHFGGQPAVSWCGFARAILAQAQPWLGRSVPVDPVPGASLPRPAARPANGVLDCQRYVRLTGRNLPAWAPALATVVEELAGREG